ncbi:hypothetical protein GE21DRAFT_1070153 [Neurospora crassa]|nr:hypothetical protein GE21DRAFT_1070153 [Neurospora crassa]
MIKHTHTRARAQNPRVSTLIPSFSTHDLAFCHPHQEISRQFDEASFFPDGSQDPHIVH